jgi:hypothetical protein
MEGCDGDRGRITLPAKIGRMIENRVSSGRWGHSNYQYVYMKKELSHAKNGIKVYLSGRKALI